jgi:hypothetical protein
MDRSAAWQGATLVHGRLHKEVDSVTVAEKRTLRSGQIVKEN